MILHTRVNTASLRLASRGSPCGGHAHPNFTRGGSSEDMCTAGEFMDVALRDMKLADSWHRLYSGCLLEFAYSLMRLLIVNQM